MSELTNGMIAAPELWSLTMFVESDALDVLLLPPTEGETAIYRRLPLDPAASSQAKALEEVIYDNPLLLSDFRSVTALIDTPQTLIVPPEVPRADYEMLMERAFDSEVAQLTVNTLGTGPEAVALTAIDPEVRGFLSRTYYNIRFFYHLSPLTRSLANCNAQGVTALVQWRQESLLDLVVLNGSGLLVSNTFECTDATDALFFIASALSATGHTLGDCSIRTAGNPAKAASLELLLSKYAPDTAAARFPSLTYKLGAEASSIPLQMLLQCE